jgi:hypothetical protein
MKGNRPIRPDWLWEGFWIDFALREKNVDFFRLSGTRDELLQGGYWAQARWIYVWLECALAYAIAEAYTPEGLP